MRRRVRSDWTRVLDGRVTPASRGEVAQPDAGPGLVVGGPALDAGDRQAGGVLLHAEQVGPASVSTVAWRRPAVAGSVSRQASPGSAADPGARRGLVDLEVVGAGPGRPGRAARAARSGAAARPATGPPTAARPAPRPRRRTPACRAGRWSARRAPWLTRYPASGGSGRVLARLVRSSPQKLRLRSALTMAGSLIATCMTKPRDEHPGAVEVQRVEGARGTCTTSGCSRSRWRTRRLLRRRAGTATSAPAACAGERSGGHSNSFGSTDHSLNSRTGTSTRPRVTCDALVEPVEPDRVGGPGEQVEAEQPLARRLVVDRAEVRVVGGVRQQAGREHHRDAHQQHQAEHRGQPRAADRAAPERPADRPRRTGLRWRPPMDVCDLMGEPPYRRREC